MGVTNQPDIARGKITKQFLDEKHRRLLERYPQFSEVLVCPHTETDLCDCRKPKPGLLQQTGTKYHLDFSLCWVIGDSRADIEAGTIVRAKTIFIQTNHNCTPSAVSAIALATAVAKNTKGALKLIASLAQGETNTSDA